MGNKMTMSHPLFEGTLVIFQKWRAWCGWPCFHWFLKGSWKRAESATTHTHPSQSSSWFSITGVTYNLLFRHGCIFASENFLGSLLCTRMSTECATIYHDDWNIAPFCHPSTPKPLENLFTFSLSLSLLVSPSSPSSQLWQHSLPFPEFWQCICGCVCL